MYLKCNHPEIIQVDFFSEKKNLIPPELNSKKSRGLHLLGRKAGTINSFKVTAACGNCEAGHLSPPRAGGVDQHDHRLVGFFSESEGIFATKQEPSYIKGTPIGWCLT